MRLIFSADVTFKKTLNLFSANIELLFRYRNEKKLASSSGYPLWEFTIEPKKGFVDFGGMAGLNYTIFIKGKSSLEIRTAYRLYNKSVNPISFGLFFNRHV